MQKDDHIHLLKPDVINSVKGLLLIAKVIVDRFYQGHHGSKKIAPGMEFSQYRNYEAGDDLRLLDWKMLARSGRYYIRQADQDANIEVKFVLDTSASMLHEGRFTNKLDYAKVLIASLGYLSNSQGDEIGLYALNDYTTINFYPKTGKQHFNRFLQQLVLLDAKGKWPDSNNVTKELHSRGNKELIIFFTDFYERDNELFNFLKELKTLRNEVIVFHLLSDNELHMQNKGVVTFEDMESGKRIKVDTKTYSEEYQKRMDENIRRYMNALNEKGIKYHYIDMDANLSEVIQLFLNQRNKLG